MRQHRLGSTGSQHVRMVDVPASRHHGVHQGQDLASRKCSTDTTRQVDHVVDQSFETKPDHQGGHQQKPGVGHQVRVIEGHLDAVDSARYWRHRKCLLLLVRNATSTSSFSQLGRLFPRMRGLQIRRSVGASRLRRVRLGTHRGSRRWPHLLVDAPAQFKAHHAEGRRRCATLPVVSRTSAISFRGRTLWVTTEGLQQWLRLLVAEGADIESRDEEWGSSRSGVGRCFPVTLP
jgi:hypothetical protein